MVLEKKKVERNDEKSTLKRIFRDRSMFEEVSLESPSISPLLKECQLRPSSHRHATAASLHDVCPLLQQHRVGASAIAVGNGIG